MEASLEAKPGDLDVFFELMVGLETRRDSLIHGRSYHETIFDGIVNRGGGHFIKAEHEGHVISGMVIAVLGEKAWLLYVANDYEYRQLSPNKLLYWEAIKLCRNLGCRFLDLGSTQGIASFDPDNDGLDYFRSAYNPRIVSFPGYFDLPGRFYRMFSVTESRVLPLLLRAHYAVNRIRRSR